MIAWVNWPPYYSISIAHASNHGWQHMFSTPCMCVVCVRQTHRHVSHPTSVNATGMAKAKGRLWVMRTSVHWDRLCKRYAITVSRKQWFRAGQSNLQDTRGSGRGHALTLVEWPLTEVCLGLIDLLTALPVVLLESLCSTTVEENFVSMNRSLICRAFPTVQYPVTR